jgi:hypothetical protein
MYAYSPPHKTVSNTRLSSVFAVHPLHPLVVFVRSLSAQAVRITEHPAKLYHSPSLHPAHLLAYQGTIRMPRFRARVSTCLLHAAVARSLRIGPHGPPAEKLVPLFLRVSWVKPVNSFGASRRLCVKDGLIVPASSVRLSCCAKLSLQWECRRLGGIVTLWPTWNSGLLRKKQNIK